MSESSRRASDSQRHWPVRQLQLMFLRAQTRKTSRSQRLSEVLSGFREAHGGSEMLAKQSGCPTVHRSSACSTAGSVELNLANWICGHIWRANAINSITERCKTLTRHIVNDARDHLLHTRLTSDIWTHIFVFRTSWPASRAASGWSSGDASSSRRVSFTASCVSSGSFKNVSLPPCRLSKQYLPRAPCTLTVPTRVLYLPTLKLNNSQIIRLFSSSFSNLPLILPSYPNSHIINWSTIHLLAWELKN